MIGFLEIMPGLAALAALCLVLEKKARVPAALAPLTALCLAGLWTLAFGMAGMLAAGQWLLYGACAVLAVYGLRRCARGLRPGPAAALFWVLAVCMAAYLAARQPVFSEFDEFSFWGTAAKLTKTQGVLYPQAEMGWPWVSTQSPGMIVLGYFLQFFGSFAPWKVFFAYDLLLFAVFAAVLGTISWKRWEVGFPLAALCLYAPYFVTLYRRAAELDTTYLSSYGDIPAGAMLGGCLALYYGLKSGGAPLWPVLPVLCFAGLIKENTLPIALVAAGTMLADQLLAGKAQGSWRRRLCRGAAMMLAVLAGYLAWQRYIGPFVVQSSQSGGLGDTQAGLADSVLQGAMMLLGLRPASERFTQALAGVTGSFLSSSVTAVGPGVVMAALILLLFAAAVILAPDSAQRRSAACAGALTALGFLAYNFELVVSYAFIFRAEQAAGLVDYNRYLTTYYLGWLLAALALLGQSLTQPSPRRARLAAAGRAALCALAAVSVLRVWMLLPARYSVLGYQDMEFCDERYSERLAQNVLQYTGEDSRIYFVSQGDDGLRWFWYSYQLLPAVLDYSEGGGTFGLPRTDGETPLYYIPCTPQQFEQQVRGSGSTYLFIERLDAGFADAYAGLFSDALACPIAHVSGLYRVTDGAVPFQLVEMGLVK